nr:uncharacterized protein [Tanacetum cinerariifolium]
MMQDMTEEADDEEFTYVLTDEWKEFFAKSEARRRLAKKQAKKKDMTEEADDEEFTYVLTDEWKEFFAKSEARRRLAKKQAKKKGKD